MRTYRVICLLNGDKANIDAKSGQYARLAYAKRIRHKFPQLYLDDIVKACSVQVADPQRTYRPPRRFGVKRGL